jgi:hypothetical protein
MGGEAHVSRKFWAARRLAIFGAAAVVLGALLLGVPALASASSEVVNGAHSLCLDAAAQTDGSNGGTVQIWQCVNDANQQWVWNGHELVNGAHSLCLDAAAQTDGSNGGKVQIWQCVNDANQQWTGAGLSFPSGNPAWNGYVTSGGKATDVTASWTVPSVQGCGLVNSAGSSEWIGLGGVNAPLVQIGTRDICGLLPNPVAVWEVLPEQSTPQLIDDCTTLTLCGRVTPGDLIDAEVKYVGGNNYFISITDNDWRWTWSKTVTQPASSATPQTAEWIVEAPGLPLSNFGTVQFTDGRWNSGTGLGDLTSATVYEVDDSSGPQTSVSAISQYGGYGPNFTVTWLHS